LEPEFVPTGEVTDDGEAKGIFISQPGSSIATSLSDGEQKPKWVTSLLDSACLNWIYVTVGIVDYWA
jgi:hypothetical protein